MILNKTITLKLSNEIFMNFFIFKIQKKLSHSTMHFTLYYTIIVLNTP